ncbi:hypothetical protein [Eikenella longinqua]|uniref:hypothetical protein n=1 Tax=Eikenella longinqua TaxID=1795827 RepID=UPI0012E769AD|nr:hypothetical protein [Eikenella longinqua]
MAQQISENQRERPSGETAHKPPSYSNCQLSPQRKRTRPNAPYTTNCLPSTIAKRRQVSPNHQPSEHFKPSSTADRPAHLAALSPSTLPARAQTSKPSSPTIAHANNAGSKLRSHPFRYTVCPPARRTPGSAISPTSESIRKYPLFQPAFPPPLR